MTAALWVVSAYSPLVLVWSQTGPSVVVTIGVMDSVSITLTVAGSVITVVPLVPYRYRPSSLMSRSVKYPRGCEATTSFVAVSITEMVPAHGLSTYTRSPSGAAAIVDELQSTAIGAPTVPSASITRTKPSSLTT